MQNSRNNRKIRRKMSPIQKYNNNRKMDTQNRMKEPNKRYKTSEALWYNPIFGLQLSSKIGK